MRAEVVDRLARESLRAVLRWGERAQMIKTCEELAELTTQLCKRMNGSPTSDAAIVDEIADVLVMTLQMRWMFGPLAVDERMAYKVDRLANALAEAKPFTKVPPAGNQPPQGTPKERTP